MRPFKLMARMKETLALHLRNMNWSPCIRTLSRFFVHVYVLEALHIVSSPRCKVFFRRMMGWKCRQASVLAGVCVSGGSSAVVLACSSGSSWLIISCSPRLRYRGIPPTPPLLAACSTRSMSRRICSSVRCLWPLLWNHGCFLSSSTTRIWFYTHTQGKYTKDKKAWVQNSRDGRGIFFSRGRPG